MILCYHKVYPIEKTIWWVSVDVFFRQMAALQSRKVVFLDEYDPQDSSHVVITFDGVYDNVLEFAVPIMEHFGYPFELFVIGDYVGRENTFDQAVEPPCHFASAEALDEMVRRGGRVQWHTRSHGRMSKLSEDDQRRELTVPEHIETHFASPHLRWFAYPHGEVGDESRRLVREKFIGALACDDGDTDDRHYLPRRLVFAHHDFFKGRVSAIVANYNYGRFLWDAIESIEKQSVTPDEVLIIDDASTDDSAEVLDGLEARGYRVVRNEKNLGIVENFRKAVSLTSGDYVFFLGADNRARSDFVLESRVALDSNAEAAVAYTDMLLWGPRSGQLARAVGATKIGYSQIENWDIYHWRMSDPTPEALSQFATKNFVHGSSMYRRSSYDAVGGYRKSGGPEDHNLFHRMWAAGGQLIHVPLPLLEYRQHSAAQANTTLGLQRENQTLRETVDSLQRDRDDIRAEGERMLAAERDANGRTLDTIGATVAQIADVRRDLATVQDDVRRSEMERIKDRDVAAEVSKSQHVAAQRDLDERASAFASQLAAIAQGLEREREALRSIDDRTNGIIAQGQRALREFRTFRAAMQPMIDSFGLHEARSTKPRQSLVAAWRRRLGASVRRGTEQASPLAFSDREFAHARLLFDPVAYARDNADVAEPEVAWAHFREHGFSEGRAPGPLFDEAWYLAAYEDVARSEMKPFVHYITRGAAERRNPNVMFDAAWYVEAYPDIVEQSIDPFYHYLQYGEQENRLPHPLFLTRWYRDTYLDRDRAASPLAHYLGKGRLIGYGPNPFFDGAWYLANNTDLHAAGWDPLAHYLAFGEREDRDPHPLFFAQWYRSAHLDGAAGSPLRDYLSRGVAEGLSPNPLFNPSFYGRTRAGKLTAGVDPVLDYLSIGEPANSSPHPIFHTQWYRNTYLNGETTASPLIDYLRNGLERDRTPNPLFDPAWYLETYPEIAAGNTNPLLHYIEHGEREDRNPHPLFMTRWYRDTYLGGDRTVSPLEDYLENGSKKGRAPNPFFDAAWYTQNGQDLSLDAFDALLHYLVIGEGEDRDPHPIFAAAWYRQTYLDSDSAASPLRHYLRMGKQLGHAPNPLFDPKWYVTTYRDVAAAGVDPLNHYLTQGEREGRDPHRLFLAKWYRDTYLESDEEESPLRHYLGEGRQSGYVPNPLFDVDWYLITHPALAQAGQDPFLHYVAGDSSADQEPNRLFNTAWYLERHTVADSGAFSVVAHALRSVSDEIAPGFDTAFYRAQTGLKAETAAACLGHYLRVQPAGVVPSLTVVDQSILDKAMGSALALSSQRVAIGMVLFNEDPTEIKRALAAIRQALRKCGPEIDGRIMVYDNSDVPCAVEEAKDLLYFRGGGNLGFGGGHNALCHLAFRDETQTYIGINSDGVLHRNALAALLRMNAAQCGQALIEALQFPEEHPKFYNPQTLETPWISGACYLIPKAAFEATSGFDPNIFLYCEDVDLSWSARRAGFRTMTCPAAIFYHDVSDRGHQPWRFREMLVSARYLGHKWGNRMFRGWAEDLLLSQGFATDRGELPPLDDLPVLLDSGSVADFNHGFSFAPVRW